MPSTIRISFIAFFALAAFLFISAPSRALESRQDTLVSGNADTLTSGRADTLDAEESQRTRRQRLTDWMFISRLDTAFSETEALESVDPFIPFEGRYIRKISIVRLNIFGDTRVGESQKGQPWIVAGGNRLHIDTRTRIIANYFLMEEGDPVEPFVLADTERILRSTAFIQDARIDVIPVPEQPDSVDLLVLTRDVWSIGLKPTYRDYDSFRIRIYDRNFLGFGHNIEYEADVDLNREQKLDNAFVYRMNNLYGSFIDLMARYDVMHRRDLTQFSLIRGFVSPEIRYTGALTIADIENWVVDSTDVRNSYQYRDFWVGRSFLIGTPDEVSEGRVRTILSGRVQRFDYYERPEVSADTNRAYHDLILLLGSLSLAKTEYRKAKLIFGFGTTEDVPYGFLLSLTGGQQFGEFEDRPYAALELGHGNFTGRDGYVATTARVGAFFRDGNYEDGVFDFMSGGFTPLHGIGRYHFRHFATIHYTYGFQRRDRGGIELEGDNGIIAVGKTGLMGPQRFVLNYESVLFTPWDWYKFRFAFFGYVSSGNLSHEWNPFQHGARYYTSLGFGMRIHNERLVFAPLEIRFMFFPSVPPGAPTEWYHVGTVRRLPFPNFEPGPPSVFPFR